MFCVRLAALSARVLIQGDVNGASGSKVRMAVANPTREMGPGDVTTDAASRPTIDLRFDDRNYFDLGPTYVEHLFSYPWSAFTVLGSG